jgi:hypothetical protein
VVDAGIGIHTNHAVAVGPSVWLALRGQVARRELTLPTGPDETFAAPHARRRKLSLGLDAGAEEGAGAAAVALPAELSADFLDRDFFAEPVSSAFASAFSAVPADSLERLFFVVVEESAAAALSPASADFFDRLFLGVASASVDVAALFCAVCRGIVGGGAVGRVCRFLGPAFFCRGLAAIRCGGNCRLNRR